MEWLVEHTTLILILAAMCGFFMAWGVGANDVANAMGTSGGAKALTGKQAVMIVGRGCESGARANSSVVAHFCWPGAREAC